MLLSKGDTWWFPLEAYGRNHGGLFLGAAYERLHQYFWVILLDEMEPSSMIDAHVG